MYEAHSEQTVSRPPRSLEGEQSDPLQASTPLAFHHVLFPMGFPLHIRSNDAAVIRAAEDSWARFRQRYAMRPIEIRFVVSDVISRRRPAIPTFRAQSNLLTLISDSQNFGCCDLSTGFGFACVTKALTTHREYLRNHFLESMVYVLLDTQHLVAIHAACVEFQGHGVLFVGDSGAGKSSLAYACARRGWAYLSDDAASLILHKAGRLAVGNPQTLRFRPSALPLFPEIKGRQALRHGKPTIEVKTERLRHVKVVYESTIDYIVFLNRPGFEGGPATLLPMARQEVFKRLSKNPWPYELAVHERRSLAIERLLSAPAFELAYCDFGAAVDLLERTISGAKS
jgi:hypothetical protein